MYVNMFVILAPILIGKIQESNVKKFTWYNKIIWNTRSAISSLETHAVFHSNYQTGEHRFCLLSIISFTLYVYVDPEWDLNSTHLNWEP